MPKRSDIKKVLVIGAGPIVIGQACEFDYSGTQACRALREEGVEVILLNSNPATIMTDKNIADRIYIEPITVESIEKIFARENPDVLLPTLGGQTALNLAMKCYKSGLLEKYNVELIGATSESIDKAEDRSKFNQIILDLGLEVAPNAIVRNIEDAKTELSNIGLPAIIRPSFTMGGSGGGIAYTEKEYYDLISHGLRLSPTTEVLLDKSIIGWKEYEMEVVRDKNDNVIIVCSIENVDPVGVHTGDSITIAPAVTLSDKEYQNMRDASIAILRAIGVETGGANVQFAVNPKDGQMVIIEMNPRVSRSSALASKATGFPIAKVATKLAIGYSLDEIMNSVTRVTPCAFEPSIDYIVTKIPRFDFEKFDIKNPVLSTSMKSVGEVMSIGRSFTESLQKALISLEQGLEGLSSPDIIGLTIDMKLEDKISIIKKSLKEASPDRLLRIAESLRYGLSCEEICQITLYDMWFVEQINIIVNLEKKIQNEAYYNTHYGLLELKKHGFSDKRIAELARVSESSIYDLRMKYEVLPVFKRVDTCAAEFPSFTSYLYSTYVGDIYNKPACEAEVSDRKKVIIIGSGPNRIGQGIEFDYACVHASMVLLEEGIESIMINCNPETVSTDYDISDRLYFEPIVLETVLNIIRKEESRGELLGVIVQLGGQTPLKIANDLVRLGVHILGTSLDAINLAEDRDQFRTLMSELEITQTESLICHNVEDIPASVEEIGFPFLIRPSYVLGGKAMKIIRDNKDLEDYFLAYKSVIKEGSILIDKFLDDAIEVDVDALSDGKDVFVAGVMEHIEHAGIHSGDSACSLPPYSLSDEIINRIRENTKKIAIAMKVVGLINIQYAVKDDLVYVLEVNPRASRTAPFVSKATGIEIPKIATLLMIGHSLESFDLKYRLSDKVAVKEAVFPFIKFENTDVLLGPEMKSTGEVMGFDLNFEDAFAKAQIATGCDIPLQGNAFLSVKDLDKNHILVEMANSLQGIGMCLYSTKGTAKFLLSHGVENIKTINKVREGGDNIVELIENGKIDLVINTTQGRKEISDSFSIRRSSLLRGVMYFTTISGAKAIVRAIIKMKIKGTFDVFTV